MDYAHAVVHVLAQLPGMSPSHLIVNIRIANTTQDRNAIALARLDELEEDLNLSSTQYQTCVSILFVGYLLGQIPSNMLLNRVRPSRYMGVCMALWAIVSALTALSKDFTGLLLTRFFLGITESPYELIPPLNIKIFTDFHLDTTQVLSICSPRSTPAKRSQPVSPSCTLVTFSLPPSLA